MFRYHNITYLITDITLKLSLGLIFFNYGYGKLVKLLNQEADGLIGMVASIPFFGIFPLFSSWILALTETFAIFAFIYGYTNFSLSNFISRFTGFLCLIISIIIVYLHVFAWGDNLFSHGPFESLNIEEGKKAIFGQFLFIPISMYIIFNNRLNLSAFSETK